MLCLKDISVSIQSYSVSYIDSIMERILSASWVSMGNLRCINIIYHGIYYLSCTGDFSYLGCVQMIIMKLCIHGKTMWCYPLQKPDE